MPALGTDVDWTVVANPFPGQREPRDRWAVFSARRRVFAGLVAPAGPGRDAEGFRRAAAAALGARDLDLLDRFRLLHDGLLDSCRASMAVVEIDRRRRTLTFTGIGSIRCRVDSGDPIDLGSVPGWSGVGRFVAPAPVVLGWTGPGIAMLVRDGVLERWNVPSFPPAGSLAARDFAARLTSRLERLPDDGTLMVVRG